VRTRGEEEEKEAEDEWRGDRAAEEGQGRCARDTPSLKTKEQSLHEEEKEERRRRRRRKRRKRRKGGKKDGRKEGRKE